MSRIRLVRLAVTVALLASCRESAPARAPSIVRDSAGIQIVHNGSPTDTHPASVREAVRIGVVDGSPDHQFDDIVSIDVDAADTVLVADLGSASVRLYDPRGGFIRRVVRRGQGPGELERIEHVRFIGDTIAVTGMRGGTTTVLLTRAGEEVASLPDVVPPFRSVIRVVRLGGGWLAYIGRTGDRESLTARTINTDTTEFHLLDAANAPLGPPIHRLVRQRYVQGFGDADPGRDRELTLRALEVRRAREVVGATDGRARLDRGGITYLFEPAMPVAIDRRGWLYRVGQSYTIDVFDETGRHVRRITRGHEPVAITAADLDSLRIAARRRFTSTGPDRARGEAALRAFDDETSGRRVTHFPAVGALLIAVDGSIWARRADVSTELPRNRGTESELTAPNALAASVWDRFDPSGRFVGSVQLPARFRAALVRGNVVYGVARDEAGVESVVGLAADESNRR